MKTLKILSLSLFLLSAIDTNARIIDIAVSGIGNRTDIQPYISNVLVNIELGDTVDFYAVGLRNFNGMGDFYAYLTLNGVNYNAIYIYPGPPVQDQYLVHRFIPQSIGANSFSFDHSTPAGYGNPPTGRTLSGTINVIAVNININPNDLIAKYSLDGHADDVSGNNHDGVVLGPLASQDRFGNQTGALSFQGNDYVDINDGVFFNDKQFSISLWFKLEQVNSSGTLIKFSDDLKIGFNGNNIIEVVHGSNGNVHQNSWIGYQPVNDKVIVNSNPFALNKWYNIIVSSKKMIAPIGQGNSYGGPIPFGLHGGNYYEVYVSGVKVFSSVSNHVVSSNGTYSYNNVKIDEFYNKTLSPKIGENFIGHLDDINVWNTEINSLEAMAIFNNTILTTNELPNIDFNISPNPTTDFLNISGAQIEALQVFDVNGRLVLSETPSASNVNLDVRSLETGFYTVLVNNQQTVRFIKE